MESAEQNTVLVLMELRGLALVPINNITILGRVLIEKIVLTLNKKVSQDDIKYLQVEMSLSEPNNKMFSLITDPSP